MPSIEYGHCLNCVHFKHLHWNGVAIHLIYCYSNHSRCVHWNCVYGYVSIFDCIAKIQSKLVLRYFISHTHNNQLHSQITSRKLHKLDAWLWVEWFYVELKMLKWNIIILFLFNAGMLCVWQFYRKMTSKTEILIFFRFVFCLASGSDNFV